MYFNTDATTPLLRYIVFEIMVIVEKNKIQKKIEKTGNTKKDGIENFDSFFFFKYYFSFPCFDGFMRVSFTRMCSDYGGCLESRCSAEKSVGGKIEERFIVALRPENQRFP